MKKVSSQPIPASTSGQSKSMPTRRVGRRAKDDQMSPIPDPVVTQTTDAQALAASIPHNASNDVDLERDSALDRPVGLSSESASTALSAGTLSELDVSAKAVVAPEPSGGHGTDGRLAQARFDVSEQLPMAGRGLQIAERPHSRNGSLWGPSLMDEFILCEKITQVDHEPIPERIVRERMLASLSNVSPQFSAAVADSLGMCRCAPRCRLRWRHRTRRR